MPKDDDIVHYLLVYSFDSQELVSLEEYSDSKEATQAYAAAELKYRHLDRFEIVLLGADSVATVMETHGHYFRSSSDSLFSDFLRMPEPQQA